MPRIIVPHLPHHVTHRGNDRRDVFLDAVDRRVYLALLARSAARFGTRFWAFTLMTNHIHLVAVPSDLDSLARTMNLAQMSYSRWFHHRHGGTGHLWGDRYYSNPVGWSCLSVVTRYVELNPVRAGITRTASEYPWSSASTHLHRSSHRLLDPDRPLPRLIGDWGSFLAEGVSEEEVRRIRESARSGRPFADPDFVRELEARTGRRLLPRRAGRIGPRGRPVGLDEEPKSVARRTIE